MKKLIFDQIVFLATTKLKIKFFYILFIVSYLLLNLSNFGYSQTVNQEWVARYNGTAAFTDYATDLTIDNLGNVYVTGYCVEIATGHDIVTVKYNSNGVQQWVAKFSSPGFDDDRPSAIVVDGQGNVYVTGYCGGSNLDNDIVTIKYNSNGVEQWVRRYNGPINREDWANEMTIDSFGNIYITGSSFEFGNQNCFITIKYNPDGIQQWISKYIGPGNGHEAVDISLDGSGNVYVFGSSFGIGTASDFALVKYNSNGIQQWVARYNGLNNNWDVAKKIDIDASGNIYVTGYGHVNENQFYTDYITIKYNSNGIEQWVRFYNGMGNREDETSDIVVDRSGNVYVTGVSNNYKNTYHDYATIKYNTDGIQQWVAVYNGTIYGPDYANAIALDSSGNIYVTGQSWGSVTQYDYTTIKYNPEGLQIWLERYKGFGNGNDYATAIAIDVLGNVYITGSGNFETSGLDYTTIKYSQLVNIQQTSTQIPTEFNLFQNYPNPFNPVTTINFSIPKLSNVNLIIYDISGKEISTLVNEKLNAGTYKYDFNGESLTSGIYFYRIQSDNFVETKKMILIK